MITIETNNPITGRTQYYQGCWRSPVSDCTWVEKRAEARNFTSEEEAEAEWATVSKFSARQHTIRITTMPCEGRDTWEQINEQDNANQSKLDSIRSTSDALVEAMELGQYLDMGLKDADKYTPEENAILSLHAYRLRVQKQLPDYSLEECPHCMSICPSKSMFCDQCAEPRRSNIQLVPRLDAGERSTLKNREFHWHVTWHPDNDPREEGDSPTTFSAQKIQYVGTLTNVQKLAIADYPEFFCLNIVFERGEEIFKPS